MTTMISERKKKISTKRVNKYGYPVHKVQRDARSCPYFLMGSEEEREVSRIPFTKTETISEMCLLHVHR